MSEIDAYADPECYLDDLEVPCDYGLEFCIDPDARNFEGCCSCDYMCGVGEYAEEQETGQMGPSTTGDHFKQSTYDVLMQVLEKFLYFLEWLRVI